MVKKRKGKKGSMKFDPKITYIVGPLVISLLLSLPVWAFTPFDQPIFLSWMIGASITTFGIFGYDKGKAKAGDKRVPEINLHLMSIVGGAAGGLIGMFFFRHKIRKKIFFVVNVAAAVVHGIIVFFQLT